MKIFKKLAILTITLCFISNVAMASETNAWKQAKKDSYYSEYITNYPDGKKIQKATSKQEYIDYKQSKSLHLISYYSKKYPSGKFYKKAKKLELKDATKLEKGNSTGIAFSEKGVRLYYKNTSVNNIATGVQKILERRGYSLNSGDITNGKYEIGSKKARIFLGGFVKRAVFNVNIVEVDKNTVMLKFEKGMSGKSGGLIGQRDMKCRFIKAFNSIYKQNF